MYQSLSIHTVPTNPYQEWSIHLYNVPILVTQSVACTNTVQPTLYYVPVLVKLHCTLYRQNMLNKPTLVLRYITLVI